MRSIIASLRTLVLPWGATSGPRILLDGIRGVIEVYNTAGDLFGFIDPARGIGVQEPDGFPAARLVLDGAPLLVFDQGVGEEGPPVVVGDWLGRLALSLSSGRDVGRDDANVVLYAESANGSDAPVIVLSASDVQLRTDGGSMPLPSGSLARGLLMPPFVATSSNGPHAASTVTDMQLTNVPAVAGRPVTVHLHTQVSLSAAVGIWDLQLRVDGTPIDRFARIQNTTATSTVRPVDASLDWTPSATGATSDIDVFASLASGTATLQLDGAPTARRTLKAIDQGAP